MTKTFTIRTDDNGFYQITRGFSPPGPFGFSVDLHATVTSPPGAHVACVVTLNNSSGPQSKTFTADSGVQVSLGTWRITSGSDVLVISGRTDPKLVNTDITVDVEANLDGF